MQLNGHTELLHEYFALGVAYARTRKLKKQRKQNAKEGGTMSNSIGPKEHYNGTAFEGLDAFERQLKRFGIEIPSSEQDSLEPLFRHKVESVILEVAVDASSISEDSIIIPIDEVDGLTFCKLDSSEIEIPFDADCRVASDPPTFKSL